MLLSNEPRFVSFRSRCCRRSGHACGCSDQAGQCRTDRWWEIVLQTHNLFQRTFPAVLCLKFAPRIKEGMQKERSSWENHPCHLLSFLPAIKSLENRTIGRLTSPMTQNWTRWKIASSVIVAKWSSQGGVDLVFLWICKRKSQEVQLKEKVLLSFWGQPVGCKAHLPFSSKGPAVETFLAGCVLGVFYKITFYWRHTWLQVFKVFCSSCL